MSGGGVQSHGTMLAESLFLTCFLGKKQAKEAGLPKAVTKDMRRCGFFIKGQSVIEYALIFVAVALSVVFFISRMRGVFDTHFQGAAAHILK